MATTIQQAFSILRSNLEITGLQQTTVSERQRAVRAAVERRLEVVDSFLTGSYARHTMIAPLKEADVDVLVVLADKHFSQFRDRSDRQAALLDEVRRVLRETYPRTPDISRNGQAVTIRFSDFLVDVVPAFNRQGGGYFIPNSVLKTWTPTDPKAHVQIAARANEAHGGDLAPLVKMIKAWNRTSGSFFSSFHLEVIALQTLEGVHISDYPSGARFVFDKGRDLVSNRNPDPAGYSEDVGAYINTAEKVHAGVAKFATAYERAVKAEAANSYGHVADAFSYWRQVFGDYFPAYG